MYIGDVSLILGVVFPINFMSRVNNSLKITFLLDI